MKKPVVDHELCIGCGVCEEICPDVFSVREEKSWVIDPNGCDRCDCEEAAASCPTAAIEMKEG